MVLCVKIKSLTVGQQTDPHEARKNGTVFTTPESESDKSNSQLATSTHF